MQSMNSVMILVKEKTVYVHLEEILKNGELTITNTIGKTVFQEKIADSHYEVITLNKPEGKYWIKIDSDKIKTKKSFHLK